MLGRYTTGAYTLLGPWASLASEHSTRCSEEIEPAVLALVQLLVGLLVEPLGYQDSNLD